MAMLDQIIAKSRESIEWNVLGLVLQKGRNLMSIQSGVFNYRLDRSGPFLAVGRMPQQFGKTECVPHGRLAWVSGRI